MPASTPGCWWGPYRTVGNATVVHVVLTPHVAHEASAVEWLDAQERSRWESYQHDGPRRRFALCRAALRSLLCGQLGCRNEQLSFGTAGHGKPFAMVDGAWASVCFNVSHSMEHGLIAFAPEGRLGIDVEERVPRSDLDALISAVLTPDEQAELAAKGQAHKTHSFFDLWTIKEALVKALGTGFTLDVSSFEVPPAIRHGAARSVFRFPQEPEVEWQMERIGNERFAAAVAQEVTTATRTPTDTGEESQI